jgi:hypothetical protein
MLESSNTKWTSTRVRNMHNAPFAGLADAGSPSGAFAGASQGVVAVVLGLGLVALLYGIRQDGRKPAHRPYDPLWKEQWR